MVAAANIRTPPHPARPDNHPGMMMLVLMMMVVIVLMVVMGWHRVV